MRCPDCNKFVSTDSSADPEVDDLEIDDDGRITGSVRIINACAECGTELTEATFDLDIDAASDVTAHREEPGDHEISVEEENAERTDRRQTHDARGRVIPPRYQKTYYGASLTVRVTCSCQPKKEDRWSLGYDWCDEVQASGMNEV